MAAFSLPFSHQRFNNMLHYPSYSSSASAFSLLVSTLISDLTILEFISWTTNLRKQIE
jgi:hypothetical protein